MKTKLFCATLAISGLLALQIGCSNNPVKADQVSEKKPVPAPAKDIQSKPDVKAESKPAPAQAEMQADNLMNQGVELLQAGKYPEALKAFEDILKLVGDSSSFTPTTLYNLACTHALMEEPRPALRYLRRAVRAGFDNQSTINSDPDLESLRELPEYKRIIESIAPVTAIIPTDKDEADQKEALRLIEEVRGLKFKTEPKYKIMAPDQFARAYGGGRDTDSIMGFYRWDDKTLYLKQGLDPEKFKGTRIHETFHALQDQIFGMSELRKDVKTTDGNYAILGLIEGDATLTFIECMPESMARVMISSATPWRMMGGAPKYDKTRRGEASVRQGAFGYAIAARFVQAVKEAKGWDGVNAMYSNIPKSTEQVLHPEKYLAGEQPVNVSLPELASLLGPGWETVRTDTLGEFSLLLGLLSNDKSGPLADDAAMGWAGDTIVMLGHKADKKPFTVHKTVWDTDKDAQEFFNASVLAMESEGELSKSETSATLLNDKGQMDYLELRDRHVYIVNGMPTEFKDKLIPALVK